jgi:hypothetical protein
MLVENFTPPRQQSFTGDRAVSELNPDLDMVFASANQLLKNPPAAGNVAQCGRKMPAL